MNQLPFEVGYVSTMSDAEMLNIADQLEADRFWDEEERLEHLLDRFITHWRLGGYSGTVSMPALIPTSMHIEGAGLLRVEVATKRIDLHVPQGIDERTARLLAEMQYREQSNPNFDPTDDE